MTASKTRGMILAEQLHGSKSDQQVKKLELFRPLQKKLRSALKRFEAVHYRGQKLLDGKTICGSGILTDDLINSLQNYYGDVIWRNKADIDGMMRGVQATLLHFNSRDKTAHHHVS